MKNLFFLEFSQEIENVKNYLVFIENNQGFFSYNLNDQVVYIIIIRKHMEIHKKIVDSKNATKKTLRN